MASFFTKLKNQLDPFDGGKTWSNPNPAPRPMPARAPSSTPASQPAQGKPSAISSLRQPASMFSFNTPKTVTPKLSSIKTPSYGANPLTSTVNRVRDVFDANTPQDYAKRAAKAPSSPNLTYQQQQQAKGVDGSSIAQNPMQRAVVFGRGAYRQTVGNTTNTLGTGLAQGFGGDVKKANTAQSNLIDQNTQLARNMANLYKTSNDPATKARAARAFREVSNTNIENTSNLQGRVNKQIADTDPRKMAAATVDAGLTAVSFGAAGATKQGLKTAVSGVAKTTPVKTALTKGLAGAKYLGGQTAIQASLGGAQGAVSPYITNDPNKVTGKEVLQSAATGAAMNAGMPLVGLAGGYAVPKLVQGVEKTAPVVKDVTQTAVKKVEQLNPAIRALDEHYKELNKQWQVATPQMRANIEKAIKLNRAERGRTVQGGYVKNPFGKDIAEGLSKEQADFINEYANMLEGMGSGNGVDILPTGARASNNYRFGIDKKNITKQDWFDEARKQIESGKAAYGASEDYKTLPKFEPVNNGTGKAMSVDPQKPEIPSYVPKDKIDAYLKSDDYIKDQRFAKMASETKSGDPFDHPDMYENPTPDMYKNLKEPTKPSVDPLEALKAEGTPKTVKVFIKSKFRDGGGYADLPVIRKEENITLYQGGTGENRQFWTPNKDYAKQFGNGEVVKKTGTFYQVDNGNRMTDVYVEAKPTQPPAPVQKPVAQTQVVEAPPAVKQPKTQPDFVPTAVTETKATPPVPPSKPPVADTPPQLGTGKQKTTRYASKTVPESKFVSDPIKETTKKNAPLYTPENEKVRYNQALTKYEKVGRDKFENDLFEQLNGKKGTISSSTVAEAQTLAARLDAEGNYAKASEIYDKVSEHLTASGQTIQAAAIMSRRSPEGLRRHAMQVWKKAGVKVTPEAERELVTLTQAVKKAQTPEAKTKAVYKVNEHVKKQVPDNIWNKSVNIWRAGLLTSPVTTTGNLLANTGEAVIRKGFVNPVATAADKAMSIFTGKRTMTLATPGSATSGTVKGVKTLPEYMKTGFQPGDINLKSKYENSGTINYGQGALGKTLGGYVNGTYRLMGVADAPFRMGAEGEVLSSIAKAEAINKGLKGTARQQFIDEFMANPPKEVAQRVANEGTRATFQNDTLLNTVASGMKQSLEKKSPAAKAVSDFVMPFVRTPSAIATRLIERTPIGLGKEVVTQMVNMKSGKPFDQRAMAQAIGNGSFGAVAIGAGMALANADLMTYGFPQDQKERDLWELEGKQPYSVKVGDRWYSLNYLQPFGTLLSIGGQAKKDMDSGLSAGEATTKALATAGQSIQDQSFLKGINGILSAISDPERSARKYMEQTFSSLTPNFARGFARASDSVQREPVNIPQSIASGIPGLRQNTPVKKDVFGNDLPAKDTFLNQYVNPLRPSKVRTSELTAELRNLNDQELGTFPTESDKNAFGKNATLKKDELNNLNATVATKVSTAWNDLIKTKEYKELTPEDKKKTLDAAKRDYAAVAKAEWAAKNNKISDEWQPDLSSKQKALASGNTPDYINAGLPKNLHTSAKKTIVEADGLEGDNKTAWLAKDNKDTTIQESLKGWNNGKQMPKITNEVAKEWADYQKDYAEGKINKLEASQKKKTIIGKAYKSGLDDISQSFYTLGDDDMKAEFNKGTITKEQMDRIIETDNKLTELGIQKNAQVGKKLRYSLGYGAAPSGPGSSSGGSSKKKKAKRPKFANLAVPTYSTANRAMQQMLIKTKK